MEVQRNRGWCLHVRPYMAVSRYMLLKNFHVERILIEPCKVFLSMETHKDSMGVIFKILISDTPWKG